MRVNLSSKIIQLISQAPKHNHLNTYTYKTPQYIDQHKQCASVNPGLGLDLV